MTTTKYLVAGMTCEHCVASVTEEVEALPGVHAVQVDLDSGAMTLTSIEAPTEAQVREAVAQAGYRLA